MGAAVGTGYIMDSPALAITGELQGVGAYLFLVENSDSVPHAISIFSICLKTSPNITLQLWHYREMATDNTHIAAGSTGTVSWHCATAVPVFAGYRVFKGSGFSDDADPGTYQIEASKPIAHGWQVTVHAVSSDVTAYTDGVCDTRRLLIDSIPSQSTTLGPGQTNTVGVACLSSGVLLSGGFEAPDGQDVIVTENAPGAVTDPSPSPISAWHVTGVNTGQVSHTLRAYALCGRVAAADLATPTPFTTVTPSATPSATP